MRPAQQNNIGKVKGPRPPALRGENHTQNPRRDGRQQQSSAAAGGAPSSSFLTHAPLEALLHQPRPSTITAARWDDVSTRDLKPREFTHGFARIGIDNQGPLLFEVDQRHLLFLVKQFNDLLLDGEQLMRRTKRNPSGESSVRGAVDPPRRAFAPPPAPPRGSSLTSSVFRVGGASFIAEASQELLQAQLRSQRREDGVRIAQDDAVGAGLSGKALLSKYEPFELQAQLCGVPPIAAVSLRFRLSPWRSLFETWIVALMEERRPSHHGRAGAARRPAVGQRQAEGMDLCWQSVRPQRAHAKNVDSIVELEMLVQLAFRVADLEQLSNSISLGGMLLDAPAPVQSTTPPATASSAFANTLGSTAADPHAPRKQAIRAKALAYERMVAPPRGVPHLICTATAVYALSEYLVPLFGDCAPFVKMLMNTILPLMLHPSARQTVSNALQVHPLGGPPSAHRPQECAVRYVQCTYAHELTQHLPLLTVVKHRTRDKALLRHRQDGMITMRIKEAMLHFIQSLFQQWRNITRRHRALKVAIGQLLVTTSNTEVVRRSISRWSFTSRARHHGLDAAHNARGSGLVPPAMLHRLSVHASWNASGRSHHGATATDDVENICACDSLHPSLSETQQPCLAADTSPTSADGAAAATADKPQLLQLRTTSPPAMLTFAAPSPTSLGVPPSSQCSGGTAHPIAFPFSPLIRAAGQMAVQSAFSPVASPRAAHSRSSRGGSEPHHRLAGSVMSAASTPRAGATSMAASSPVVPNIWDPKTPSEKHKRTTMLASALRTHVMHRNALIAKFEYTDRQALMERLSTLDDAIKEYTKAVERVGLQFRTAMDALFPLIPSPLGWDDGEGSLRGGEGLWTGVGGGDSVGRRAGMLSVKHPDGDPAQVGGESPKATDAFPALTAAGQRIDPIDMTLLNAAGLEARRSSERVAAASVSGGDIIHAKAMQANKPGGGGNGLTSLSTSTASTGTMSLQVAEQQQNQEIMRRQERIFHWLMHLAKHDVAASGNRLSTYLHRCCNERSASLSLSVVARSTHLLPALRVLLLALVPPSLPHFQLVDLFSEELLTKASTEPPRHVGAPPEVTTTPSATVDNTTEADRSAVPSPPPHSPPSSTIASTLNSAIEVPLLGGPARGSDASRRGQQRRKSSVNFAGERPEEHMPELREEQEALDRRQSEQQLLGSPQINNGTSRRRSSHVVGFSPLDAGGLQPFGPPNEDANSSSGKSPLTEDINAAVRGSIFGGGGRRRSLMAKLNVVTMRAAQQDDENSGETFSKRYIRRQSAIAASSGSSITVGDASEAVLMHRRKSVEIHQEKTPASISSMESAALGMVLEHRKGFLGTLSGGHSMFASMQEDHGTQQTALLDISVQTAEERQQALKAQEAEALQREEEQQVSTISEELERTAREKEFAEVLKGILECCDVTSVTHLVLKLSNRLLKRSTMPTAAAGGSRGNDDDRADFGQMSAATRFLHEQNLLRLPGGAQGGASSVANVAPSALAIRVFPSLLSRHLVLKHNNWRHVLMSALYYTQVGPTCMAFRNIYTGMETRARKPLKSLTTEERYEIILGARKPVEYYIANTEVPAHDPLPTTPQAMHQLCNARRQRKKDTALDVEEANALTMFHDAARDVSLKAFYGVGLTTTAGQVYDQYCAASPDIADASFILPSFMAQKMRIVFGPESSFWKPVTSVRLIKTSKELEDVVTTLAPLARVSPQDLCDRLLAALDDMDLFFVSLSSAEVEDAYTACLPEITVVFSLYSSGDPLAPAVCYENWMAMNQPLCDANYTMAMADTIYNTVARRLYNQRVQEQAIATGAVSVFQLNQSLVMPSSTLLGSTMVPTTLPSRGTSEADAAGLRGLPGGGARSGTNAADVCRVVQLDLDSFCDALSVLASMKFPNPFTPLEQKVVPFVQTLLVPLVGAKSKDMRRRMQGGGAAAASKKEIRRGTVVKLEDLSFELRTKITMIREKQRYHHRPAATLPEDRE